MPVVIPSNGNPVPNPLSSAGFKGVDLDWDDDVSRVPLLCEQCVVEVAFPPEGC